MNRLTSSILLAVIGAAYTWPVMAGWNLGHFDFGDGNYAYISARMVAGDLLYRDILAPQPPVHLVLGAIIHRIGVAFLDEPLFAFRAYSLILHLATMVLIHRTTIRLMLPDPVNHPHGTAQQRARFRPAGVLAAFVYMVLPLGFWWTQSYQSEPTEMLLMVAGFHQMLSHRPGRMPLAGALFGLAALTNMTAAPYALFTAGYLGVRHFRRLFWPFTVTMGVVIFGTVIIGEIVTGAYLENVILNQVGSFPRENPVQYAIGKILNQGAKVSRLEGGWIVIGLIGLIVHVRTGPRLTREIACTLSFFALCSIIYTAKGGTMDYIFTIGEPFLALFAGIALHRGWRRYGAGLCARCRRRGLGDSTDWVTPAATVMAAIWIMLPGIGWMQQVQHQEAYEYPERETLRLVATIKRLAPKPDDLVLAPPHYAYLARRKIVENYSETYLWMLKYHNERADGKPAKGVATALSIAQHLRDRKIAAVVFDDGQTGTIPEIREALQANYQPEGEPVRTLNRTLQVWRPKN
jgi:hypothetical protein